MRHLSFCSAIGFAILGFLMLSASLLTFISIVKSYDLIPTFVLAGAMLLPFMIGTLSGGDSRTIQPKKNARQLGLKTQAGALLKGKPWILPSALARAVLIAVVTVGISWFEFFLDVAYTAVLNVQVFLWTSFVILLVWLFGLIPLLSLRAANTYILRSDGLEIRTGIVTSKSFVISPLGFSDLEVTQSISGRITNSGDIIIRSQGEREVKMEKVRNPLKIADQIREVMVRPTVRIERQEAVTR